MTQLNKYFIAGKDYTVKLKPGANISASGPWISVIGPTEIDRFYIGDFMGAEYTIAADYDADAKEVIKLIVAADIDAVTAISPTRATTNFELVDVSATINASYVSIIVTPKIVGSSALDGVEVFFTATYLENNHSLTKRR